VMRVSDHVPDIGRARGGGNQPVWNVAR
jgi:hypothetical protein